MGSTPAIPTVQQQAPPVQAPLEQAPPVEVPAQEQQQQQPEQPQYQPQQHEHQQQQQPLQQQPLQQEEPKQEEPQVEDPSANITPEAQPSLRGNKARVEYRDANGNVLDESLVSSLRNDAKVQFETRYEFRSRLSNGHEVDVVDGKVAPPHPDVQGQEPETVRKEKRRPVEDIPAPAPGKESSVDDSNSPEPKPVNEGNEATEGRT